MDAVIAVIVVVSFLLAFWRIGWWRWFWLGIALYLGLFELAAKLVTGHTISQQYWIFAQTSPLWWLPALLVAVGGLGLALHLVWKRIGRKSDG